MAINEIDNDQQNDYLYLYNLTNYLNETGGFTVRCPRCSLAERNTIVSIAHVLNIYTYL